MKLSTQAEIAAAERVLKLSWVIVAGAVLFSVLTVTPLVQRVTPDRWDWTAPILPIVVDAAVIIVVRIDAIIARLGGRPGGWSAALRWLTGALTLALNVGDSMLKADWVGVGVHMVAPVLLITTAEATLAYRRSIMAAVERIEAERREQEETRKREQREREARSRAEREAERAAREAREQAARQAEQEAREQAAAEREREREHAARIERENREHAARIAREEREAETEREALRLRAAADERREKAQQADRERERLDRERKAKEAAQKPDRDRRAGERPKVAAAAVSTSRPTVSAPVSTPAHETAHDAPAKTPAGKKMTEEAALVALAEAVREGRSQRQIAALTGWSTGWVAKRVSELEGAAK